MRNLLGDCIATVSLDDAIKAVLICAKGRAFCSGVDIEDIPHEPFAWRKRVQLAQTQHMALARLQKPVIAAVQGAAVGGGASLALAADILVMSEDAFLGFPFVRLGLVPDGGAAALLQAKTSPAVALDVLLSGGRIDAAEAGRVGLTRRITPPGQHLQAAQTLAEELSALPSESLSLTKSLISRDWMAGIDAYLAHEADAMALASTTAGHLDAISRVRRNLAGTTKESNGPSR